jgi:hypothetical protein
MEIIELSRFLAEWLSLLIVTVFCIISLSYRMEAIEPSLGLPILSIPTEFFFSLKGV